MKKNETKSEVEVKQEQPPIERAQLAVAQPQVKGRSLTEQERWEVVERVETGKKIERQAHLHRVLAAVEGSYAKMAARMFPILSLKTHLSNLRFLGTVCPEISDKLLLAEQRAMSNLTERQAEDSIAREYMESLKASDEPAKS